MIQGDDPHDPVDLPKIILRDAVAWYADAPEAVGYYEIDEDSVVIGLPSGTDGIETISARLIGEGSMRKLSGVLKQADADGTGLCYPCILVKSVVRPELPKTARDIAAALSSRSVVVGAN